MNSPVTLLELFIHPQEKRLRTGWRLLVNIFLFLFLSIIFSIPILGIMLLKPEWLNASMVIATAFPIVLSVVISHKLIDRRSMRSLGLELSPQAALDILVGIGISAVQLGLVVLIESGMGWLSFGAYGWQMNGLLPTIGGVLLWLVLFIAVGFYEELFSRGYHLQNLEEGLNTFWAVLLSSVFFGILHMSNPAASGVSTLGIMLAGVFLAFAYLRTRTLWLAVGLHLSWNFILGPVLGFPVSGIETATLLSPQISGPEIWTGGEFGPEAGLVVVPALLLGALLVWLYTRGRLAGKEKIKNTER